MTISKNASAAYLPISTSPRVAEAMAQSRKPSVLFICVKNAGKSQMAAGLMSKIGGDTVDVYSAGTNPGTEINALSAEALREVGVDITANTPKPVDPQLSAKSMSSSRWGEMPAYLPILEPGSKTGIPTNPPNAASMGSNACASSVTTSRLG